MDIALEKGVAVGIIGGTCSIPEEQILTAALFALGEERSQQVHTFVCNSQQQNDGSSDQPDPFQGLSIEQSMAAARARVSHLVAFMSVSVRISCQCMGASVHCCLGCFCDACSALLI